MGNRNSPWTMVGDGRAGISEKKDTEIKEMRLTMISCVKLLSCLELAM